MKNVAMSPAVSCAARCEEKKKAVRRDDAGSSGPAYEQSKKKRQPLRTSRSARYWILPRWRSESSSKEANGSLCLSNSPHPTQENGGRHPDISHACNPVIEGTPPGLADTHSRRNEAVRWEKLVITIKNFFKADIFIKFCQVRGTKVTRKNSHPNQ